MSHGTADRSALDPGPRAVVTEEDTVSELETDLRLATHLRALSRVSLATGHDIRTPLHTIVLYLELLRSTLAEPPGPDKQARQERYVDVVGSEVKNLETMLDQLLNQTRVLEERIERFDLVETVRDLHGFLEPHRRRTRIEFPWRAAGDPIAIEGDRGAIRHALVTILIAAIEATPAGGELDLGITAADGLAKITISGGTVGLVPAILDGTRGEPPKEWAIDAERGLYVARRVVERHGGAIKVRSDGSRVATLEIQLPLAAAGNG
jgi:signal transduction histidine kinase